MQQSRKTATRRDFFRYLAKLGGAMALTVVPASLLATEAGIRGMRLASGHSKSRLVLDLSKPVKHSLFTLSHPERIVVDIRDTSFSGNLPRLKKGGLIKQIRSARRNQGDIRVVLELNHRAQPKSFSLLPNGSSGHRLVIDLFDNRLHASPSDSSSEHAAAKEPATKKQPKSLRNVIVAIDAGHGGKDSGARGRSRTREKDITLAVSKRLKRVLDGIHGIQPVMIRKKDKYISLRERIHIARRNKADLFVSIHADAFRNSHASGASVYTLSNRGATSEAAQWLADKENTSDLFGGVSIRNRNDDVAEILLDMAQSATIQSSLDVGGVVLNNLSKVGKVHKRKVEQAGFAVLKSPDIPSILVETAFISNPREEKKLRTKAYQEKLAKAIASGVRQYFKRQAPPGTILSGRSELNVG